MSPPGLFNARRESSGSSHLYRLAGIGVSHGLVYAAYFAIVFALAEELMATIIPRKG
jgi:hypothetical protein